jgi:hypothetical protein
MQWKRCIFAAREPRYAQPVSWLRSLLGRITLQIIPLGIITIERNDLVFNKEKWPGQKKQNLILGRLCWIMAEPIWQIVWKNVSSLLVRSWRTWRALTRAGQSTMLFVLGRVDLLDGVTTALEDASISWLLGLSRRSCSPPALVMTGCPCCFFPLGNESFHLCQRAKTHTHTYLRLFCLVPLWLATWLRYEIFLAERERNQIKGTD